MSGFLGGLLGGGGGLQGMIGGAVANALPGIISQIMSGQAATNSQPNSAGGMGGGFGGLIQQFEAAGLGQHMQSWIGGGENQPVSPQQLGGVFAPEQVAQWAQQAGTTPEALMGVLAHVLPHAIDHATPDGQTPEPNAAPAMPDFGALLGRLLGR